MPAPRKKFKPFLRLQVFCNLVEDNLKTQNYKVITVLAKNSETKLR